MIFARARALLIGAKYLPLLELYIQVLANFPKDIDEHQIVIKDSILVLASKANNAVILDLVPIVGFKFICLYDFMSADLFICLSLVPYSEDKRIQ